MPRNYSDALLTQTFFRAWIKHYFRLIPHLVTLSYKKPITTSTFWIAFLSSKDEFHDVLNFYSVMSCLYEIVNFPVVMVTSHDANIFNTSIGYYAINMRISENMIEFIIWGYSNDMAKLAWIIDIWRQHVTTYMRLPVICSPLDQYMWNFTLFQPTNTIVNRPIFGNSKILRPRKIQI